MSPGKDVSVLRSHMLQASFLALSRIAGFRSLMLLFRPQDDTPANVGALPAVMSLSLQPAAVEYVLGALLSGPPTASPGVSSTASTSTRATSASSSGGDDASMGVFDADTMSGHYTMKLHAVDRER
jgi:hypothetical protein